MTAPDQKQTVRSDWIERARAVTTGSVLYERGILKGLKGRNGQLAGPCPNCGGRDRFGVNLKKGLFNCRGCGTGGGDAIALVKFLDGGDFLRAVETLVGPPPKGGMETDEERCARAQSARERHERLERERIEREAREAEELRRQHRKARWLWSQRQPIGGTIAERYLREARGITCPLPATLGFLPPRKPEHHPAMIAAFALPDEIEPGLLGEPRGVEAVHLTLLRADGSDKAEVEPNKITVGSPGGLPIVLAPPNDLFGLAITEGIEDSFTVYQSTGVGAWAAGPAGRLPTLAEVIPDFIDSITIFAHPDKAGRVGAHGLAKRLDQRGIEVLLEGVS
jgi:putative DNA primase/helicase